MARAAVPGRLIWRVATVDATKDETATARTLVLDVPGWPGHLAGQHVDVRLTADDGYSVERSYSIASAADGTRLELTVQRIADGEVSPYLTGDLRPGDKLELRGPVGGWFVWDPSSTAPVLLVAGAVSPVFYSRQSVVSRREAVDDESAPEPLSPAPQPRTVVDRRDEQLLGR